MDSSISLELLPNSPQSQLSNGDCIHKLQILSITFFTYSSVHALRTSYSFCKSQFPQQIGIEEKYIGLIDSAMLMFLGIGNFIIAISPPLKPIKTLWIALILCAIQFTLVPVSMTYLYGWSAFFILLLLMSISGFIQSFTWPNILSLAHTVAKPEKDGAILGLWATNGNIGNIIGFIISQYLVLGLGLYWQISPIVVSIYMATFGLIIYFRIQQIPEQTQQRTVNQKIQISECFKSPKILLTALSFSLLKSVMYGILLWLPAYFHQIGLIDYELYIPMMFDASSIIGSIILGTIFKRLKQKYKNTAMIPCLVLLIIFFMLLKKIDFTVGGYFAIISCVGFCLGGSYNTMTSLVTMQLVANLPEHIQEKYLRFYSASLMAIGYTITAITQTIIGLTVAGNEDSLFEIFLIYTIINLVSIICLSITDYWSINGTHSSSSQQNTGNNDFWHITSQSNSHGTTTQQIQMTKNQKQN